MARFCSTRPVTAVFCVSLLLAHAFAAETFTTEFGNRKIPVDFIKRALQPHLSDVENIDLSRVVYEIIGGNQLVGFNTKFNLKDDTTLRPSSPSKSLKYTLNGNERLLEPSATVRYGKGFTVMHRASDGRVAHVFGNGLNLKPLDAVYPNVFVNTLAINPNPETATDPVEVVKRIAARNDLTSIGQNSTVRQTGSCAAGTTHILELAVAFDNQFCEMFSNDEDIATAAVQTLVNQADEVFQEFTCVSVALVHIEAHCKDPADPYTVLSDFTRAEPGEDPSSYIQRAFGDFWEQSRSDVERDAAYFFSGFDDGSNVAGRAGLGTACNRFAYGWSEKLTLTVFIHEVGHLVGSEHTADGIMIATGFTGGEIFFSQDSISMITAFVDSTADDCLSVSAPTCDTTCPGPCVNGQCIARFSSEASPGIVPCSAVGGSFRCVDSEEILSTEYPFAADCPAGFRYVARDASEANEPDTFCCMDTADSVTSRVVPADYQLIQFTLNLPEGPRVFPEYIRDPEVIESRTLLQTELVPSCQLSGGSSGEQVPSTSTAPNPTAVPTPTPISTAVAIPTPVPSAVAVPTPIFTSAAPPSPVPSTNAEIPVFTPFAEEPSFPEETATASATDEPTGPQPDDGTCGGALADSETFACESSFADELDVVFPDKREVPVMVRLLQRRGMFVAILRARDGAEIREVASKFSFDGKLGPDDLGPATLFESMPSRVKIEEDAFKMALPEGATTCCGEKLNFFVQLEVCIDGECVSRGVFKRKTKVLCSDPCDGMPGGTVVPFSETKRCPSCLE